MGGEPVFRGWKGISDGHILGEKHTVRAEGQCISQSMCKGGGDRHPVDQAGFIK